MRWPGVGQAADRSRKKGAGASSPGPTVVSVILLKFRFACARFLRPARTRRKWQVGSLGNLIEMARVQYLSRLRCALAIVPVIAPQQEKRGRITMLHNLRFIERRLPHHSGAIIRTLFVASALALGIGLLLLR